MEFKRTLTENEVIMLGDKPEQRLHEIIDEALKRMSNVHDAESVESRIISLMTTVKPMKARDIMEAHNAIYRHPIALTYARFVISGMYSAGLLNRVGRGEYVKFDREAELERVNRQIMKIENTGQIAGREREEYNNLIAKRRELTK